ALERRLDEIRNGGAGDVESEQARGPLAEAARGFERFEEVVEGGAGSVEEALARLRQSDAPGRAGEEGDPDPGLEGADDLADRGRGHAEILGRGSEAAPLRDSQEHLEPVDGIAGDCVFLLHGLSRL